MISLLSLLGLPLVLVSQVVAAPNESSSLQRSLPNNQPSLTAITVRSAIQRRDELFRPKLDCEHHYAAGDPALFGHEGSRFAKTAMKYKLPALVLEDIETSVQSITCTTSAIIVEFSEREIIDEVRGRWDELQKFLIISSHSGCNVEGERAPYFVSGIEYDNSKPKVIFSAKAIPWKAAYDSMTVKFGMSTSPFEADSFRHEGLRKRAVTSSTVTSTSSASSTATTTSKTQSASPAANTSVSFDIGFGPVTQNIFNGEKELKAVTGTLNVDCKDCSVSGTLVISEGQFVINNPAILENVVAAQAVDFLGDGFFNIVANNMTAHVGIETSMDLAIRKDFNKTLTTIGIPGFTIPNIATIGPFFKPIIKAGIEAKGKVDFNYGFDLKVPDNSTMFLNIGQIKNSTISGFKNASITALPLTASSPELSVTLSLGLVGEFDLGISILNDVGELAAGAFLELPTLTATIKTTNGAVDEKCQPAANISATELLKTHIFPNLTTITGNVGVALGVQVEGAIKGVTTIGTSATLLGTQFSLPTACFSFDGQKKNFVKPTFTSTSTALTGTATGTGGVTAPTIGTNGSIGGGSGVSNKNQSSSATKMREMASVGGGSVWWSGAMLLSVFFVALSL
ncbi:hypothetical protein BGZ60DRAFT_170796 [Tricladium varicosporioides]|nr:hypothetical protein BGZ60DRAFT_170796 [Hymenoscyphus varicosporioides]